MFSTFLGKMIASKLLKELGLRIIFAALGRHVKNTDNTFDDELLIIIKDTFGRATEEELASIKKPVKKRAPSTAKKKKVTATPKK